MAISRRKFLTFSSTACLILMAPLKAGPLGAVLPFIQKT